MFCMNMTLSILITPIIGLLSGMILLGNLLYWRGGDISLIRVILWILWIFVLFGGLGLVATKIEVLPYSFFSVTSGSLLFGLFYLVAAPITLGWWRRSSLADVLLVGFIFLFIGISGFSLVYGLLSASGVSVYYCLTGLLAFLVPAFLVKSYDYWMVIPKKKYKTWIYPVNEAVPQLHRIDPIKLVMNFTPVPSGKNGPFEGYEVEFPTNLSLSELFHYFISFHNKHREFRKKPIQYMDGEKPLEWVLFKYSDKNKKIYLDMEKSLLDNSVRSNEAIYAMSMN